MALLLLLFLLISEANEARLTARKSNWVLQAQVEATPLEVGASFPPASVGYATPIVMSQPDWMCSLPAGWHRCSSLGAGLPTSGALRVARLHVRPDQICRVGQFPVVRLSLFHRSLANKADRAAQLLLSRPLGWAPVKTSRS